MFRKIIKRLYQKFYPKPVEAFFVEIKEYTKDEQHRFYLDCERILKEDVLIRVKDMFYVDSEKIQLYESDNTPIRTTEADLERFKRIGVAEFFKLLEEFARRVPKDSPEYDKHSII